MRRLASQTGGGHFVLGQFDDVNATFTNVMQELHYQYVLGFAPQRFDGRVHELEVRVKRPGYTVRARQSYLAPRGEGRLTP
jgi:Ca-activated chloride channel family protein